MYLLSNIMFLFFGFVCMYIWCTWWYAGYGVRGQRKGEKDVLLGRVSRVT